MPTDRRDVLLAVLRARGPTDAEVLSYHPVIRKQYPRRVVAIEADLKALVEAGDAVALSPPFLELDHVEAYDVADAERLGWRARYQRRRRSIVGSGL